MIVQMPFDLSRWMSAKGRHRRAYALYSLTDEEIATVEAREWSLGQERFTEYELAMIQSFADKDTEELFELERNHRFAALSRVALRKLIQMNQASALSDLAVPPVNRLEALRGRLSGFHPIRINDQWRLVFRWTDAGPEQVAIVNYH